MDLHGRVALVTGGKRIGAAVATALAARGADIALCYRRSADEAAATADDVRGLGRRAHVVRANLAVPDDCRRFVEETARTLGRVDVLVNMASVYNRREYDALTDADWDEALAVDLRASHVCAHAAVPHMRRTGGGRIVNCGDWVAASRRPRYTGYLPYYVAKAGVLALTEALALELAPDILVNAIAPGPIVPPPGTSTEELRAVERATPLGRWGGVDEVAKAVLLLVETDFITGETVRVDGGRHVR